MEYNETENNLTNNINNNEQEDNNSTETESNISTDTNTSTLRFLEDIVNLTDLENTTISLPDIINSSNSTLNTDYFLIIPNFFSKNDSSLNSTIKFFKNNL